MTTEEFQTVTPRARSTGLSLSELKLDFNQQKIEHYKEDIAFANIRIHFGNPSPDEIIFCQEIINRANNAINDLSFKRRALQLKLQDERRKLE